MSLTLYVDGDRWREHLRATVERIPGIAPVIKGNGYGFGAGRLARRAEWLEVPTVCVGTWRDAVEVAPRCSSDILVMEPVRPTSTSGSDAASIPAGRVIRTVSRLDDLDYVAEAHPGSRCVLELMSSMRRHGMTARQLQAAAARIRELPLGFEGVALHLPLASSAPAGEHLREVRRLMLDVIAAELGGCTLWVSHLTATELGTLRREYADFTWRARVGTDLWLGDREALAVRARVLDVHPVDRGDRFGYRHRTATGRGHLVVVSGGTAHGIGLEAPSAADSFTGRLATVARGGLDAAGVVRSPFRLPRAPEEPLRFAEPPHMQVSMLFVPGGTPPPDVGSEVEARVRFTATDVDEVVVS